MTENWDKICRMCSHQTEVLDSLFEKQRNFYLPDIIKEAFGLQVLEYDNLPTKICKSCTTRILFIEDSRQEFLKNDMKLRKILAQNINIEMVPIEDPADGPSPISSRVKVEVDEDVLMRESFVNSMNDNNHPPPGIKVQHSNSHEGHHSEQHFGENNEVKSFLAKTGLLNLLQAFEKHEIEYENIALLTEKHIEAITPIANRQINLRKAIQKYFYQQNAQYTVVELEETQSPARPQHVTLDKICAYSEVGKKFLDYYQQHKTYDDVYRDYLARAVVDYYYQNNSKFFDSTYKEMTKIITDYLPNELPETWYYCDSDQRTGGKLYLRYSYITRPIRKAGCSKMARTKRSMEADKDFDIDKQKSALFDKILIKNKQNESSEPPTLATSKQPLVNFKKPEEVVNMLGNDLDFRIIRKDFEINGTMSKSSRSLLSHIIIKKILEQDMNRLLNRFDLTNLTNVVVTLFPNESTTTYYVPSAQRSVPTGKLYEQFNSYRTTLAKVRLISRRNKNSLTKENNEDVLEMPNFDEMLQSERKSAIKSYWLLSQNLRSRETFEEWLTKYTFLWKFDGFEYFVYDSEKIINADFEENWAPLALKIYKANMNSRKKEISQIISTISGFESRDNICLISLMILPFLLPVTHKRTSSGSSTRSTQNDTLSSFIKQYDTLEQAQEDRSNISHPIVKIIGDLQHMTATSKLVISSTLSYDFDKPLMAVDVLLRIICTTKIKTALECKLIYTFLKKYIFKLDITVPSTIGTLFNDLKRMPEVDMDEFQQ